MNQEDVPSPIDLKSIKDAQEWELKAMQRPFRLEFFEAFYQQLSLIDEQPLKVLELGSGPGFLAEYLLSILPNLNISLLDNSLAMHSLANKRLNKYLSHVKFIEVDFKQNNWNQGLDKYDAVITLQAVHELRHKRYATELHKQVRPLIKSTGVYLFCDHYYGQEGMKNNELYMSIKEQYQSLDAANYSYKEVLNKGGRCLYNATIQEPK